MVGIALSIVSEHLLPDEELLWAGQPKRGFQIRAMDFWAVPFMLCWCTGVVYFLVISIRQEGISGELLFMGPFVLLGLYWLFGRFWIDAKVRSQTYYGITEQRALIISSMFTKQVRSIYLNELLEVQFTYRSDGTGTLEFFTQLSGINKFRKLGYNRSQSWWPLNSVFLPPAFEMIPNPRDVETLILQTKEKAEQKSTESV